MALLMMASALLLAYCIWITWKYHATRKLQIRVAEQAHELERQRALKQNLERVCDGRGSEIRRLRARNAQQAAALRELEEKTSELNVTMFRESGLRILAEKEEGARRMKMELMEKQLDETRQKLRDRTAQAESTEQMYQAIIAEKDAEIARLQAAHARRAKTRAKSEGIPDQISLDEIMDIMPPKPQPAKHRSRKKTASGENAPAVQ